MAIDNAVMRRIAKIERRMAKATRGPWKLYEYGTEVFAEIWSESANDGEGEAVAKVWSHLEPANGCEDWDVKKERAKRKATARFIQHAREDIPWLLAQLKERT